MILIDSYMCHGRNMVYGIWGMVIHPTSGDIAPIVGADSHPSLWDSPWLCMWPLHQNGFLYFFSYCISAQTLAFRCVSKHISV